MKKLTEDDLNLNGEDDFTEDKIIGENEIDTFNGSEENYAEVEMTVAEPTKITDIDGAVVLVTPGDTVTIKSESLKRLNKPIEK